MACVALFHSALGVRPGIVDAAEHLRRAGHEVLVVDQYEGVVFDSYEEAGAFVQEMGFPELMRRAVAAVEGLDDGFVSAGFSNGGGMAEHVAMVRPVGGVLMLSGALPLAMLGVEAWPEGVPGQIHYALDDPLRYQSWIDALVERVRAAPADLEVFDYEGDGHLFTDPSLPAEYDAAAAALLWERVVAFCEEPIGPAVT
jgi:dienelactone hydrolase